MGNTMSAGEIAPVSTNSLTAAINLQLERRLVSAELGPSHGNQERLYDFAGAAS